MKQGFEVKWSKYEPVILDITVAIVQAIYDQKTCNVLHKILLSESTPVLNRVKQGCILSPLLFNVTVVYVMFKVGKTSERGSN